MGRYMRRAIRQLKHQSVWISVLLWNILFLLWYTGTLTKIQENGMGLMIAEDKDETFDKGHVEAQIPMIQENGMGLMIAEDKDETFDKGHVEAQIPMVHKDEAPIPKDGLFEKRQDPILKPVPLRRKRRVYRTAPPRLLTTPPAIRPAWIIPEQALSAPKPLDVTVVTAFLNIGKYYKEDEDMTYRPSNFEIWIKIFKRIQNPVIAYFENDKYINTFKALRNKYPDNMTRIIKVDRKRLWAFMLRSKIQNIFRQRLYPQHKPETTNVDYSCNTHSKYDFMDMAISSDPFGSPYYAWLDIGTFRNIAEYRDKQFMITVPARFNKQYIGFTLIGELQRRTIRPQDVVEQNLRLVDSQFFIGKADVLKTWVMRYKEVMELMIREGWISGDEQVISYMAHPGVGMSTKLHTYHYIGNNPSTMKHVYLAYRASTLDTCELDLSCKRQ